MYRLSFGTHTYLKRLCTVEISGKKIEYPTIFNRRRDVNIKKKIVVLFFHILVPCSPIIGIFYRARGHALHR